VDRDASKHVDEPDTCDRCEIPVSRELWCTISRKHCVIEPIEDRWVFRSHPENPSMQDVNRERSTWLKLDEGEAYHLPIGCRDGMVALLINKVFVLIERVMPMEPEAPIVPV
jgi:hypothetical protein